MSIDQNLIDGIKDIVSNHFVKSKSKDYYNGTFHEFTLEKGLAIWGPSNTKIYNNVWHGQRPVSITFSDSECGKTKYLQIYFGYNHTRINNDAYEHIFNVTEMSTTEILEKIKTHVELTQLIE